MTFQWSDYLVVADDLLQLGTEAHHRSAISRAYYGVFGSIRQRLEQRRGQSFPGDRVHSTVIRLLQRDQRQEVRRMGQDLSRLRSERNAADYDLEAQFSLQRAVLAKQMADSLEPRRRVL
jgi:uncharacterized protein (UPF0332 family)